MRSVYFNISTTSDRSQIPGTLRAPHGEVQVGTTIANAKSNAPRNNLCILLPPSFYMELFSESRSPSSAPNNEYRDFCFFVDYAIGDAAENHGC